MGQFVCKVADSSGRVFQQVEAAQSESEARQKLADRGLYVYTVRPRVSLLPRGAGRRRESAVGSTDFLIFNQQFNTLIKAGLPILKALDLLTESAAAPKLRPVLEDVRRRVREGALLSEALEAEGIFPKVYTTCVLAGEKSGSLTGVLDQYIAYQRVTTGVRKRLLAALVYPTILVTVAVVVLTYVVTYVIPQFARLYAELNVELPVLTQFLVALTVGFRTPILAAVGLIVLAAGGAYLWSFTEQGSLVLDKLKLRIPLLGDIWIKFQVARFVRTLATLLAGGTPLVAALETSSEAIGSRWISGAIYEAAQRVREGQSLHASLAETHLLPELAMEMIEVGEASGALTPMLTSVAEFYEEDVNLRLTALLNLVEPLILVIMAIVVAFILIALYLPIFSFSLGGVAR
jgi:type IV pilus assembly protein PilC